MTEPANSRDLPSALTEWRAVLGEAHVVTEASLLQSAAGNTCGIEREIPVILRPGSSEDVVALVDIANRHRVPLYPVSCGRNWGLGSRLPTADGVALVELHRMNRISEVNVAGQYAVIEPGVTQQQLHDHLVENGYPLVVNVTGSGADTSLLGNSLDRGIGYFASRADSLSGLEVVLGTGQVLRTGFAHYADCQISHVYRHGHGPFLDGLFSQGNFGIVTQAGFRLMPKKESNCAAIVRIDTEEKLGAFVNVLADLNQREVIRGVTHIGNWNRTESTIGPHIQAYLERRGEVGPWADKIAAFMAAEGYGAWSAIIGLAGTRRQVRAEQADIRSALAGYSIMFVDERRLNILERLCDVLPFMPTMQRKRAILPAIRELYGLSMGRPTNETVKSVYWASDQPIPEGPTRDPDVGHCGLTYVVPMLPATGEVASQVSQMTLSAFGERGFKAYVTFNLINSYSMEGVINLSFDRSRPERVVQAREAVSVLDRRFRREGWYPYRLRVDEMDRYVDDGDLFWQKVRDMKQVFDPNHIIAPGRYNLV